MPPEISESFSFKETVSDDDLKVIAAAVAKLQLGLGNHLRMKSTIMKSQLKVSLEVIIFSWQTEYTQGILIAREGIRDRIHNTSFSS